MQARMFSPKLIFALVNRVLISSLFFVSLSAAAQETRLLRQPSISDTHISFVYGGDLWIANLDGKQAKRLTSTPAVESEPHFSPDGNTIAFSSNRSGNTSVYVMDASGGEAKRLTWHANSALVRGWSKDGKHVLFASDRDTAPVPIHRLWTISAEGGPAKLLNKQWAHNGAFSPKGDKLVIDRTNRWDVEWRNYRGGQNLPLTIIDLQSNQETFIPSSKTIEIEPVWLGERIYFISDRDWIANVWAYSLASMQLEQITFFEENDVKQLSTNGKLLAFEHDGYLYTLEPEMKEYTRLAITIKGDFPWAEDIWKDVSESARAPALSPTGKRALFQARGEIFTVPVENGDVRNLSKSSGTADRKAIWSPLGDKIAWFADSGPDGYHLVLQSQDGMSEPRFISIGESKMAWEPVFSPDAKHIAFVDDDVRIKVLELESGRMITVDIAGTSLERGSNGLSWSPDSNWLAYSKGASNNFRQIWAYSVKDKKTTAITNRFADSFSPAWDKNGKHLYFLASTDYGLNSGWANTSAMGVQAEYAAYVVNLAADIPSPFAPKSDEEEAIKVTEDDKSKEGEKDAGEVAGEVKNTPVKIDFENIARRILPLDMPPANYASTLAGNTGEVFVAERSTTGPGLTLHKFSLEKAAATAFISGIQSASMSHDSQHMLVKVANAWQVIGTGGETSGEAKHLNMNLQMKLSREQEWQQIFAEAWRYQRDYFYDPNMHGRDWNRVLERYSPLAKFVKHRSDLNYLLDMVNGELSAGHSFVWGGDFPDLPKPMSGLLGADLRADKKAWKISRIYTTESWNPGLNGPLDKPGLDIAEGDYIVGINGIQISSSDNIYQHLEGTVNKQTVLHINSKPSFKGAKSVTVLPIDNEGSLRQRTWVEDNRRKVDELSDGKLAYIWVPNTSSAGFDSFTRYYFAQQDKLGAVIDERFNGGGLLDDYMVDLMSRELRAAITNEVPNGAPLQLPAGIKGPKVLLVNELAGSGGDYFPWAFRQQNIGPLIGTTTWGGLISSAVHYAWIDGGAMTAPDLAVFDPIKNQWIGENVGIEPDIKIYQDAKSVNAGRDPQLERGVQEVLNMLEEYGRQEVVAPPFSTPAIKPRS